MPQNIQRLPQSQIMNRPFPAKQQQHTVNTGHLSQESLKQEPKLEAVDENSESEMDRETRLENWNRRLLQVRYQLKKDTFRFLLSK